MTGTITPLSCSSRRDSCRSLLCCLLLLSDHKSKSLVRDNERSTRSSTLELQLFFLFLKQAKTFSTKTTCSIYKLEQNDTFRKPSFLGSSCGLHRAHEGSRGDVCLLFFGETPCCLISSQQQQQQQCYDHRCNGARLCQVRYISNQVHWPCACFTHEFAIICSVLFFSLSQSATKKTRFSLRRTLGVPMKLDRNDLL